MLYLLRKIDLILDFLFYSVWLDRGAITEICVTYS